MKKYLAILSVLVFTGVQTGWADVLGLGAISVDGSLEVKGQQASNETDLSDPVNDKRGATATRVRIGLNTDIADDVKARIEAVRTAGGTAAGVAQFGDGSSTIAGEEAAIQFQNAYLDLGDFLHLNNFRIGRQYVGRPGDLLLYVGPIADDSLTVNAIDALTVTKKIKKVNASFGTGKAMEDDAVSNTNADDAAGAGDTNVTWLIFNSDELFSNIKLPLELGYYSGTDSNGPAAGDNNSISIINLRAGYAFMDDMVKVGLEYAMNGGQLNGAGPLGTDQNYKGTALLLNARYDNNEEGWGVGLRYANASGDDKPGNADDDAFHDLGIVAVGASDYRYGEILSYDNAFNTAVGKPIPGGLNQVSEGGGLNVISLEGWYTLPWWDDKLKGMAGYYIAKANEVAPGADDGIGSEIDLSVNYMHSETMGASLGYAMFSPDKGLATALAPVASPPQDDVTKATAKLWVKWGGERAY